MKHLILIIMALICLGCNSQPSVTNIPEMEYGDCESHIKDIEVNYIMFELSGILEFAYNAIDDEYYLDYDDPDAFDLDNLAYLSGMEEWYADYLIVHVSKDNFFELIEDVNKSVEERLNIVFEEKWILKEIVTPVEGGLNYQYYVIKNPNHAE